MSNYQKGKLFSDHYHDKKETEQIKPSEIIIPPDKTINIVIDYPLTNQFEITLKPKTKGWTRLAVVEFIIKCYKQIYKEEEKSSKIKSGHIPNMFNRNQTDGKYGIWGHDLSDLILHSLDEESKDVFVVCCDS